MLVWAGMVVIVRSGVCRRQGKEEVAALARAAESRSWWWRELEIEIRPATEPTRAVD